MGSGAHERAEWRLLRAHGRRRLRESTRCTAEYLKDHPDAAPVGTTARCRLRRTGAGICPSPEAYRRAGMEAFRQLLRDFEVDGVWLDYHHAHASWEAGGAEPARHLLLSEGASPRFQRDTG